MLVVSSDSFGSRAAEDCSSTPVELLKVEYGRENCSSDLSPPKRCVGIDGRGRGVFVFREANVRDPVLTAGL